MTADETPSTRWQRELRDATGWTPEEWNDLYRFVTARSDPGSYELAEWLRHPPQLVTTPTPAAVRGLLARHGGQTTQVLNAVAAGASERFAVAFLGSGPVDGYAGTIADGWANACRFGLSEPQAVGWAATGHLYSPHQLPLGGADRLRFPAPPDVVVSPWINHLGPDAWLHVLAGITLDEAIAMGNAGTTPTQEQLRVMAVLNGRTLPTDALLGELEGLSPASPATVQTGPR